jgi:transposase InsO family protein
LQKRVVTKPIRADGPMEHVEMDLVDLSVYTEFNDGYIELQTIIDKFSNFPWAFPIKSRQAEEIIDNLIIGVIKLHGRILVLHTNNGGEFVSKEQNGHLVKLINEIWHGAPHQPTIQGDIKAFNKIIERELAKYLTKKNTKCWIDFLEHFIEVYRHTKHPSTNCAPYTAFYGRTNILYYILEEIPIEIYLLNKEEALTFEKHGNSIRETTGI